MRDDTVERLRGLYRYRERRWTARLEGDGTGDNDVEERSADYQRLLADLLRTQKETVFRLRREGRISDQAMNRIVRDLDLEESRLE